MTTSGSFAQHPRGPATSGGAVGRRRIAALTGAAVIAGPTVLAFFTGGYFEPARVWAALVAWVKGVGAGCVAGSSALTLTGCSASCSD